MVNPAISFRIAGDLFLLLWIVSHWRLKEQAVCRLPAPVKPVDRQHFHFLIRRAEVLAAAHQLSPGRVLAILDEARADDHAIVKDGTGGVAPPCVIVNVFDVLPVSHGRGPTGLKVDPFGADRFNGARLDVRLLEHRLHVLKELPDTAAIAADSAGHPRAVQAGSNFFGTFLIPYA